MYFKNTKYNDVKWIIEYFDSSVLTAVSLKLKFLGYPNKMFWTEYASKIKIFKRILIKKQWMNDICNILHLYSTAERYLSNEYNDHIIQYYGHLVYGARTAYPKLSSSKSHTIWS